MTPCQAAVCKFDAPRNLGGTSKLPVMHPRKPGEARELRSCPKLAKQVVRQWSNSFLGSRESAQHRPTFGHCWPKLGQMFTSFGRLERSLVDSCLS